MQILPVQDRSPLLLEQLLNLWERSVKASHLFLSPAEIASIKEYVPQALAAIPCLIVALDEDQSPLGFMGIQEESLEMLFLSPEARGKGLGKELLLYGIQNYGVNQLAVNEQNPLAKGFYEHMGFRVDRRADLDEQGNSYPLLYMKLD